MRRRYILIILAIGLLPSCQKVFLEKKPNTSIVRPQTLEDLERILDNEIVNRTNVLAKLSSDEYYVHNQDILDQLYFNTQRNAYSWEGELYGGETGIADWNQPFQSIFYANNVLDELPRIKSIDQKSLDNIKGWALFIRAYAMYDLVNNFAPCYDLNTAEFALGIPIRLTARIDKMVQRSSVKETYGQIFQDLNEAQNLLLNNRPTLSRNRPSKAAVYALKARIYLSMRMYEKAEENAGKCLSIYNDLTDFNTISRTSETPFSYTTSEVIFFSTQQLEYATTSGIHASFVDYIGVDSTLIDLFEQKDLRKAIFFNVSPDSIFTKKRMYTDGGLYAFTGLGTDEMYLIKAEGEVRRGAVDESLSSLNSLLKNRYEEGYTGIEVVSQERLLQRILEERRKELVWRGLRWSDLKRLNMEGANITIKRNIDGREISLPPNDPKYIFPIPDDEIAFSNIKQNKR